MDGWIDGWMSGWMDRWIDKAKCQFSYLHIIIQGYMYLNE